MRERRVFMLLGIVLAVLALGLAYAAVSSNLEITGSATGNFDPSNFQVIFSEVTEVTGTNGVNTSGSTATIDSTDPTKGTFSFNGFTTKGQTQSATWTISNENDAQLSAYIETITESEINREYFRVTCELADDAIAANEETTVTVKAECIKTPDEETVYGGEFVFSFEATSLADEIVEGGGSSGGSSGTTPTETITTATAYVGYYADMDRDGTVDGVIFSDQGYGQKGDGEWGNDYGYGTYSVPKITSGLKEYEITQESYTNDFGTAAVISPVEGTSGTTDRFYVMALDNFTTSDYSTFYWYEAAWDYGMSDYATYTSQDFGTGKANTSAMITKWKASGYGAQNTTRDLWGVIQSEVSNGWFIPSRAELTAFGGELGEATLDPALSTSNYSSAYGLSSYYWSSSQYNDGDTYIARFGTGCMYYGIVDDDRYVRLCATF